MVPLRSEAEVANLVGSNQKLVEYMVNRYMKRCFVDGMERADLISWGNIGLINAARAWDPSRGAFSTLACRAIERMIIRGANKDSLRMGQNYLVPLDEYIASEEEADRHIDMLVDDSSEVSCTVELRDLLRSARDTIHGEGWRLLIMHYCDGYSLSEIARLRGVTRQAIAGKVKRLIRLIQTRLAAEEVHIS